QGGEPLYARARRGEAIEAPEREVEIERIVLLALAGARLRLAATCGAGTDVRSLARDLGGALGGGGHTAALRRAWCWPLTEARMHTLEALEAVAGQGGPGALDPLLLPVGAGLAHWPAAALDGTGAAWVGRGQTVPVPGMAPGQVHIT